MNVFSQQIEYFKALLLSPAGLIMIMGGVILAVGLVSSKGLKWWTMGAMFWVSTFSYVVVDERPVALAQPLETVRLQARPLTFLIMFALIIPTIIASRRWRLHPIGKAILAYFIFEIILALRIMSSDVSERGLFTFIVYIVIFITLGYGLGRWLQDWDDVRKALRAVVITAVLLLLGTCYQLALAPSAVVRSNRLFATTGNPQHAALVISGSLPVLMYFVLRRQEPKIWRLLLGAASGFLCAFLFWTGSRTGWIVAAVGILLLVRARIGRMLAVILLGGAFVALAMQVYGESTAAFTDSFLRGDTRSHVWSAMFDVWREHKLFGAMSETFGVGENSYLAVAMNTGLLGLVPLAIFVGIGSWQIFKLQLYRKYMGEETLLVDLITAVIVALAVGAAFEGYLLGTMTFQVYCIYTFFAIVQFILDWVAAQAAAPQPGMDEHGELDWHHQQMQQTHEDEIVHAGE